MSLKIDGLDDAQRALSDLERRAREMKEREVSFTDLFPDSFIQRYTDFETMGDLVEASGFKVESTEDFGAIPDDQWDAFIRKSTRFPSWKEMMKVATKEYVVRELGLA